MEKRKVADYNERNAAEVGRTGDGLGLQDVP